MAPPDDPSPRRRTPLPEKIGRYRILDRVGRGAMGVVYAAHDDAMGRPVAVKVLMGDLESDPETRARFYREAQAAAGLLHPNIITIYDAGEDQGRSYIAMQLLEGWPLSAYLKRPEAVSLERKLDLMVQMCEGLAAAHGRGIVHRDLKPGNLFVQSDGLLKILDFGVARLADSSMTATGAMLGTPDYMSPEQARGTPVDARSDIFSTGAVYYFMLAGKKPFPGPDLPAVLRQLQSEQPAPLLESEAPPELARLVMQALAKDPSDRPARVQDLLAGIVRFRRHYQAETRRLAAEASARVQAVVDADAEVRRLAGVLDLDVDDEPPAALRSLMEQVPSGTTGIDPGAFDRARATQVLADIESVHQPLDRELDRRRRCVRLLEEGDGALRTGDARAALRLVSQVRQEYPSSRRAVEIVERVTAQAREQETREQQVAEILAAARTALEARDWQQAISQCDAALALAPDLPAAASMLAEAQQGSAREQRRRDLLVQQALDRAAVAIEEGRFDAADAALGEVHALDPQAGALAEMRADLEEARHARAEAERVRGLSLDEVRLARGVFRRGRYEDALSRLHAFVEAHGTDAAGEAAAEAARLTTLRGRLAQEAHTRRARVTELLSAAESLAARNVMADAVARASDAVRCDPSDTTASARLDELLERQLQETLERERVRSMERRAQEAERMVAAAREAYARGYIGVALDAALGALRVGGDRTGIAEWVDELRRVAGTEDTELAALAEDPFGARPREAPAAVRPQGPAPRPAEAAQRAEPPHPPEGGRRSLVNRAAALLRGRLPDR